mmetsp:Transcript_37981/g.94371  ORF Transcript_37981/g.94371 Transcript_37981/m.94371 type:complete len:582 (-) Transcript_37981:406-2151(-)
MAGGGVRVLQLRPLQHRGHLLHHGAVGVAGPPRRARGERALHAARAADGRDLGDRPVSHVERRARSLAAAAHHQDPRALRLLHHLHGADGRARRRGRDAARPRGGAPARRPRPGQPLGRQASAAEPRARHVRRRLLGGRHRLREPHQPGLHLVADEEVLGRPLAGGLLVEARRARRLLLLLCRRRRRRRGDRQPGDERHPDELRLRVLRRDGLRRVQDDNALRPRRRQGAAQRGGADDLPPPRPPPRGVRRLLHLAPQGGAPDARLQGARLRAVGRRRHPAARRRHGRAGRAQQGALPRPSVRGRDLRRVHALAAHRPAARHRRQLRRAAWRRGQAASGAEDGARVHGDARLRARQHRRRRVVRQLAARRAGVARRRLGRPGEARAAHGAAVRPDRPRQQLGADLRPRARGAHAPPRAGAPRARAARVPRLLPRREGRERRHLSRPHHARDPGDLRRALRQPPAAADGQRGAAPWRAGCVGQAHLARLPRRQAERVRRVLQLLDRRRCLQERAGARLARREDLHGRHDGRRPSHCVEPRVGRVEGASLLLRAGPLRLGLQRRRRRAVRRQVHSRRPRLLAQ